ncbi:uncharacterized protein LOC128550333 isoform X2 [Mercenaria mercenaria]|uniref:uncharacterized protein LOC128550333 isoform X2 n=1 Tax=Mercenaria mercenaria TaxID=6596 RepID=UPI00234EDF9D|nr:uncharacterized protein LOC128550333 isoform X2 [Mercenaria mercenaria]
MGGLFSVPRTQRILIGDLSSLPDREQKLYELSKYVLDLENHYIGTLSNKLGIKIVALEVKSLDKSDDQSKEEPATLNDCKDISCTGIDLQTADDQPTDEVLSHETCHLFGLQHCWYFQCAMNESTSMLEAASQPLFLCPVCLRKLQYSCGFDVLSRYKKMLPFLRDISKIYPTSEFLHSVIWLEKCIEFLQSDVV